MYLACLRKCKLYYSDTFTPKYTEGGFSITIIRGSELRHEDPRNPPGSRRSDAYVRVKATRIDGSSETLSTEVMWNKEHPTWNEQLDFDVHTWTSFEV